MKNYTHRIIRLTAAESSVQSESDLWHIEEVTDKKLLKELTMKIWNADNRNWKEAFNGEKLRGKLQRQAMESPMARDNSLLDFRYEWI